MADPITFRPTAEDTKNLATLTSDGASPTEAIRSALREAVREKRRAELRADARRLADDPEYLAEVKVIQEEMRDLRAW
jgi:hypothetical protein